MSRNVFCQKLQKEAPGLDYPPLPGELGERIFNNISAEIWKLWINRQTILINEQQLNPCQTAHRELIIDEMANFLFSS